MHMNEPTLHTMIKTTTEAPDDMPRYLLVHSVNGPSDSTLRKFVHGALTEIDTGTEYEMNQRADALMREWASEGFRSPRENEMVWESLERAITLADRKS